MSSQLAASRSSIGIISFGGGNINIDGNLGIGSSAEDSFEELDPPRESKVFKGRKEDIVKLEALFFQDGKRKIVIHGLPGFGKTELAVRFAKDCRDSTNIEETFWINAETSENLKNLHKTLKKVYKVFKNKRCLFIFDNGVSRSSVRLYEPPNVENFYLLITSQIADWGDDVYQMSLKSLKMEASIDVFKEILGNRYQKDEEDIYKQMITFVSNAPLGLIVIAGHLRFKMDACKQGKFNTNHFLGELSKMLKSKIHHSQLNTYAMSISAAIFVALDKMLNQDFAESEHTRELSKKLLGICVYLNPDFITIDEIKEIMECSEESTVDECVYLSENFSFIEYYDGVIKIHRLCQRILKLYFDEIINKDYYSGCVRWLLRKVYRHNWHEDTILIEADAKKEIILEIYKENIPKNYYIEKLLQLLVSHGCFECCELIFHNILCAKIKQYVDDMKLLHVACINNRAIVLKLLLKYGDVNIRDSAQYTPLNLASNYENVDIVQMLLEKGGNVNAQDSEGRTALHDASWQGNLDIVKMLLEEGGDVHSRDIEGRTPLHDASWQSHVDIVRMLLQKGGDVHARDNAGRTPLHWASWHGNADIVRMLLDSGSDVHVRNSAGHTPMDLAIMFRKSDIINMLHKYNHQTRNTAPHLFQV